MVSITQPATGPTGGPPPNCETVCGEPVCHLECGQSQGSLGELTGRYVGGGQLGDISDVS